MRSARLLSLLDELRARRRPVSAETLASSLDVSVRTVYRDIATLQELGMPVQGESGRGYRIIAGAFLPPIQFQPDELDAVLLGMRMVQSRADGPMKEAAGRALNKIGAALPPAHEHQFIESPLLACPKVDVAHHLENDTLSLCCEVIRRKEQVVLQYRDLKDNTTERTLLPLGITCFDSVWLLSSWCMLRDDFRDFRVDRIIALEKDGTTFKDIRGRTFKDYLQTLN